MHMQILVLHRLSGAPYLHTFRAAKVGALFSFLFPPFVFSLRVTAIGQSIL